MTVYIALLRGINVGSHNKIGMDELKGILGDIGLSYVKTYIQSGNIVFSSPIVNPSLIGKMIEASIKNHFSLNVYVFVKHSDELLEIIAANPFNQQNLPKGEQIYLTFFSDCPAGDSINLLMKIDGKGDEVVVKDKTAYILFRNGFRNSPYNNLERILKVTATSRNLNTVKKLAEMACDRGLKH